MSFETASYQWQQGERRLQAAPAERLRLLERVIEALVAELRRRLGGGFTAEELVELYDAGTAWCLQVAMRIAPEEPWAWEAGVVDRRRLRPLPARGRRLRGRPPRDRRLSRYSSSSPAIRRMTIRSSSTATSTGRCPAQCSA